MDYCPTLELGIFKKKKSNAKNNKKYLNERLNLFLRCSQVFPFSTVSCYHYLYVKDKVHMELACRGPLTFKPHLPQS